MTLAKSSRGLLTHKMKGSGSMVLFCLDVQNPTVRIHLTQMFWLIGSPERGDLCFSKSVTKRPRNYVYATEQLSDYYRKTVALNGHCVCDIFYIYKFTYTVHMSVHTYTHYICVYILIG